VVMIDILFLRNSRTEIAFYSTQFTCLSRRSNVWKNLKKGSVPVESSAISHDRQRQRLAQGDGKERSEWQRTKDTKLKIWIRGRWSEMA